MKKRVLVIVAHPDDETIWMGGTILINKDEWDLTIISLCRKEDADRAPKFKKVCEMFDAKYFISDLDDSEDGDYKKISEQEIINRVMKFANKNYDMIFTHGKNGEYGHVRHIEVHNTVDKMIKDRIISCDELFFFDYFLRDGSCVADSSADKFINLNNIFTSTKKMIVCEVYGFKNNSFEFKSAGDAESFKKKENKNTTK